MAQGGLGRGLSSLIPQKENTTSTAQSTSSAPSKNEAAQVVESNLLEIDPSLIKANPYQPRRKFADVELEELAASIREYGILQPLVVTKSGDTYELIAGERRLRASKLAGLKKVPVIVKEADAERKLELALIENVQRQNLNPVELALSYQQLMSEFRLTQDQLAKKVGKSRPSVANTLRVLLLPEEIKTALSEGKVSEGHAKVLLSLESHEKQMALFRKIMHHGLSVSDTDDQARAVRAKREFRPNINYQDKDKEFAFREFFGTKAEVKRKGKGGQVIINFYSDEELRGFVEKLKKK